MIDVVSAGVDFFDEIDKEFERLDPERAYLESLTLINNWFYDEDISLNHVVILENYALRLYIPFLKSLVINAKFVNQFL